MPNAVLRPPFRAAIAAAGLAFALALPGLALAATEADYARVNRAIAEGHVQPRYERLAGAAAAFEKAAEGTCKAPPPRDTAAAKAAFRAVMDAWMGVEHVQHGPVEMFMRKFRLYYWPDRGSRGARQFRALLAAHDDKALALEKFRSASVAVQGLPAAERLLFDAATAPELARGADGDFPCRLLVAIAANVRHMAGGLALDWSGGKKSFMADLFRPGGEEARFESHKAATAEFVKGLHAELLMIVDVKLGRVIGKTIEKARPRRAESWRSGRGLRNVVANLESLEAMVEGESGPGLKALLGPADGELADLLSTAFRQTLATARAITLPLAKAVVDPASRDGVRRLARECRALKDLIRTRLAPALGTPLGFNAADGD